MLCPSCNAPNRDDAKFCKKCGQPLRVEATKIPEAAVVSQVSAPAQEQTNAEDISSAPTQIISPQQMVEYHNRRWQQELEREQAVQAQPSISAPTEPPAANEPAQDNGCQSECLVLQAPSSRDRDPPLEQRKDGTHALRAVPHREALDQDRQMPGCRKRRVGGEAQSTRASIATSHRGSLLGCLRAGS